MSLERCPCCRLPLSEAEQNEPKVEGLSFCEKCRPVMKACAAVTAAVTEFAERFGRYFGVAGKTG